jgi:hypothetical protein
MKKSICLFTATVFLLSIAACKTPAQEEIKGKDVVAAGTVQSMSGTLREEGHEWVLVTVERDYELHLGPEEYRESKGFTMTDGEKAEVQGFVYKTHISPISIKTGTASIHLRTKEGKSIWAKTDFSQKKFQNTK